jgi:aminopeptidase N
VRAGRHTAADYLTLAAGYSREPVSSVLGDVTARLGFIHEYLTTTATRAPFETFVGSMLRPVYDRLGFVAPATDSDDRKALRGVVVGALGRLANDPDIVRQARSALDRSLANGAALEPATKQSIVHIAAEHGDERLYDALASAASRATAPDERRLYFAALADFRDPRIIDRALERTLSNDIRTQDVARYLAAFFDNPVARPRAWSFVKANWTALEPKLRIYNAGVILTGALDAFCDTATRDDIRAFFNTNHLTGVTGILNQTLERINNCVDLREKQTRPVAEWLAAR